MLLRPSGDASRLQETVTAAVTRLEKGKAVGIITAGDGASLAGDITAHRIDEEMQYAPVGHAAVVSPKLQLAETVERIGTLGSQLPADGRDIGALMTDAMAMLGQYDTILTTFAQTAEELERLSQAVGRVSDEAQRADVERIRTDLAQAIRSVDNIGRWLTLVSWASKDVREAKATLGEVEKHLNALDGHLAGFDAQAAKAKEAESFFAQLTDRAKQMNAALGDFDAKRAEAALRQAETSVRALAEADIGALTAQMKSIALALPSLRDEDIHETIGMLDKLIEGHLIPNKRIQILTAGAVSAETAAPIITEAVGHKSVSISESELGIIEPNTYLEVYRMLYEVKRVLAGMTAMVLTVLFLVLDHTAVLSMMKLRHRQRQGRYAGRFSPRAYGYGAFVGAGILSAVFYLAGGGIPYLPMLVIPILGALLGLAVAACAERISPVSEGEIMAGESLGMTDSEILREIVIPSSRPGLLMTLNRFTLRFR